MANKVKKKRNKPYQGADAATARPTVTRISAVHRSKLGQWWFEHKRVARPALIAGAVVAAIVWLVFELIRIASNA